MVKYLAGASESTDLNETTHETIQMATLHEDEIVDAQTGLWQFIQARRVNRHEVFEEISKPSLNSRVSRLSKRVLLGGVWQTPRRPKAMAVAAVVENLLRQRCSGGGGDIFSHPELGRSCSPCHRPSPSRACARRERARAAPHRSLPCDP